MTEPAPIALVWNSIRIAYEDASDREPGFVKAIITDAATAFGFREPIVAYGHGEARAKAFALIAYGEAVLAAVPREFG